jgi:hypothetical protein
MTLEQQVEQMIDRDLTYEQIKSEIEDYWQEPGKTKGLSILEEKKKAGLIYYID